MLTNEQMRQVTYSAQSLPPLSRQHYMRRVAELLTELRIVGNGDVQRCIALAQQEAIGSPEVAE